MPGFADGFGLRAQGVVDGLDWRGNECRGGKGRPNTPGSADPGVSTTAINGPAAQHVSNACAGFSVQLLWRLPRQRWPTLQNIR